MGIAWRHVVGIAAVTPLAVSLCWVTIRAWDQDHPSANRRSALATLTTLRSAEADFHANDRDGNGIQDYWTGDVVGLYKAGLILKEVAEADLYPLNPLVPKPVPYGGYYFFVMTHDDTVNPPEPYGRQHRTKYAFCAFPADLDASGATVYIVHESYTGYSRPAKEYPLSRRLPKDLDGLGWNRCLGGG